MSQYNPIDNRRVALVTGATSGIGLTIAQRLVGGAGEIGVILNGNDLHLFYDAASSLLLKRA
jgi:NAD(P)-dependent dehydrogenase (short-subunit alcohol dehydrogenase family)